jgi:hypothetical protein
MKKIYLLTSIFAAVITIGCSKEEVAVSDSTQTSAVAKTVNHYSVNPPYDVGKPGEEPQVPLNPPTGGDSLITDPKYPYTVIEIPTKAYKDETCLLDISKLEVHRTYHAIQNDKLTITFTGDSVLKLNSGPTGWNSRWGSAPYVECENPDVLFFRPTYSIVTVIYLSKPCIEFGFELAPNHQDYDHSFGAVFGNDFLDYSEGFTSSIIRSPWGARLFALKATHPFTQVTVLLGDSPTGDTPVNGVAFANIRYKLAE